MFLVHQVDVVIIWREFLHSCIMIYILHGEHYFPNTYSFTHFKDFKILLCVSENRISNQFSLLVV